jgi:hypothetical protein
MNESLGQQIAATIEKNLDLLLRLVKFVYT